MLMKISTGNFCEQTPTGYSFDINKIPLKGVPVIQSL